MSVDIQRLKADCRKAAFAARKEAHKMDLDKDANAQLLSYLKGEDDSKIISSYMPIRTEVSPLPAMEKLHARGWRICVPVITGEAQPLEFHEWSPDAEMIEGAFGAFIPKDAAVLIPDIVVTPLLAFDTQGYRMGYGGGFYDRSFEQISAIKSVKAVGFAYSAQEMLMVPREKTDYPLNAVITEKGILSF